MLNRAAAYLHLPAIIDHFQTNDARGAFKRRYQDKKEDPVIKTYLQNCLRHHLITSTLNEIDAVGFNFLEEGPLKQAIEEATMKIRLSVDSTVMKETLNTVITTRELIFAALQLFAEHDK